MKKLVEKLKQRLVIKQETKHKLFILFNKVVFCKGLHFHLPVMDSKGNGFRCVICDKQVDMFK